MILTCPECKSRYVVSPSALMPRGRTVRCAKCRHSWFEAKPEDDVEIVPPQTETETAPEEQTAENKSRSDENAQDKPDDGDDTQTNDQGNDKADEAQDSAPADDFDFPINKPKKRQRPVPRGSNLPALQNQKYGSGKKGWIILIIFVATIVGSFLVFESSIKEMWPATSKLYRAIGLDETQPASQEPAEPAPEPELDPVDDRLKVSGLAPRMEQSGGVSQLVIAGYVENITDEIQSIPPLKVILRDANGQDLREWSYTLNEETVAPDAQVQFETSLPNPPAEARDIIVILTSPTQP